MKRSEINHLIHAANACFEAHSWTLPPDPHWDVTDFGLGDVANFGLVLINLADEPEYCEKLMYAHHGMATPAHCHRRKKEDIICRWGNLSVQVWPDDPQAGGGGGSVHVAVNGEPRTFAAGEVIRLPSGWRVTLVPGVYHAFQPGGDECIIGEVSTANDDRNDNFFSNPAVGRYPQIDEDEPALLRLISDTAA